MVFRAARCYALCAFTSGFMVGARERRDSGDAGLAHFLNAANRGDHDSMQVTAISTPRHPEWRWRISDYAGTTVEESEVTFASIAAAVAAGRERLLTMTEPDRPEPQPRPSPVRFGRRTWQRDGA